MPDVAQRLTASGVEPRGSTPQALARLIAQDRASWKKVIEAAKLGE